MVLYTGLSEAEQLLLMTPDDTEEASWMTMPEFQRLAIELLLSILGRYARLHRMGWHLGAELLIVMPRNVDDRNLDVGPDLFMVEADATPRRSWKIQQEGTPPRFVLEVVTEESATRDMVEKPVIYEAMHVQEYVLFAPERADDGPLLFGYHRDDQDAFTPWTTDARGILVSEALGGLGLYVEGGRWLRVLDQHGNRLPSEAEAADAEAASRQAAERRAAREARARRAAERHAAEEAAARAAAEAEIARLRALLEGRSGGQ